MIDRPKLIISDMDGTLLHTYLDFSSMRAAVGVTEEIDILAHVEKLPVPERTEAMEIIHRFEREGADKAELLPGVSEFLNWLEKEKVPLAICTRNSRAIAEQLLARFAIPATFICAREDAPPKPDPAGLELILSRFQCSAAEAVYIGDYVYDLEAAERAKIPFALFYMDLIPKYAERAHFVMNDFQQLLRWFRS